MQLFQLWSPSLVHPHHRLYGSLTVPFNMPHLVSGISFRLLSDNLVPTTLTLTHLFLHLPPHPPPLTHHWHYPLLRRCFTPGSKPSCSTNHFHPRLPSPLRTDSTVSCPAPFLLSISIFCFFLVFCIFLVFDRVTIGSGFVNTACVCDRRTDFHTEMLRLNSVGLRLSYKAYGVYMYA